MYILLAFTLLPLLKRICIEAGVEIGGKYDTRERRKVGALTGKHVYIYTHTHTHTHTHKSVGLPMSALSRQNVPPSLRTNSTFSLI